MAKYLIEGGRLLKGKVHISGNKNSVLPCLAACLLTRDRVILKNVPDISDVKIFIEILRFLGASVKQGNHTITVQAQQISYSQLPQNLTNKLRASILLAGPLLSRLGKVDFYHPGGDIIGKRSIEAHLLGFQKLGFKISNNDRHYLACKTNRKFIRQTIFLEEASVTATENLILASVIGSHTITLKNCAKEPHIIDLCNLLTKMGAKIEGLGESTLTITGVKKLSGAEFTIGPDFIELGTYAIASAITRGEIQIYNGNLKGLEPITLPFKKMGLELIEQPNGLLSVKAGSLTAIPKLHTNIWPGFPTDLMSVLIILATQAKGVSLLHDWMYESRMFFADKLINMGASITIADPHRVLVYGPTKLVGREIETPDIRAGMALVLAALIAQGESTIHRAELIERGYEDVLGKLTQLGAKITRLD